MSALLRWITTRRIGTQIAILVVSAIILAHVTITAAFLLARDRWPTPPFGNIERLVFTAQLVAAAPDDPSRATVLAAAHRADPALLTLPQTPVADRDAPEAKLLHDLPERLGGPALFAASGVADGKPERLAVAALADGSALAVPLRSPDRHPFLSPAVLGTLAFLASALTLLSLWAARQLAAPLARVARAADGFAATGASTPLPESGPLEVGRVARALNAMQARVVKLIEDRTRMLAAVSHDLRTPITRLRLRTEEIVDDRLRGAVLRDLSTMETMVQSALWFLRGELEPMPRVTTDLPSLVQTVSDGFTDAGQAVGYSGPAHLYVRCAPEQLMRAIQNLIDNGLKFGTAVQVRVLRADGAAVIEVADNGPGIVAAEKELVLEPFYRGDAARGLNDGDSFGLGLSIARSIATQNGGRLELSDRQPHGLVARLILPVTA